MFKQQKDNISRLNQSERSTLVENLAREVRSRRADITTSEPLRLQSSKHENHLEKYMIE